MNKITVPDTQAYAAILWANQKFGPSGYIIQHTFPGKMYEFTFEREDQATLFALKWI